MHACFLFPFPKKLLLLRMASPDIFPTLAHCNKKGTIKTQFRDDFNRVFWGPNCVQIAKMGNVCL